MSGLRKGIVKMFDYEVSVLYLGKLVDNIRVSAVNALDACNQVEQTTKEVFSELSAKRVVSAPTTYQCYFGLEITVV
jgi:hypothetical protein